MATDSKIEWTTHTFNPWWGCTKVSDGCKFCYAATLSTRYGHDCWGPGKQRRTFGEKHWQEPLKWNTDAERKGERHQVFCASMADVFDETAPPREREKLWALIRATPALDWQLLTKRPHLIADYLPDDWADGYANVWLGTSIEDKRVLERIDDLVQVPAIVHFLSVEPLIGPIGALKLEHIEWVIVGGESGPKARPMAPEWVESIYRQCMEAQVPFFFKQWGGVRKHTTGRILHDRHYNNMPEIHGIIPQPAVAAL